jgi:hypothetical protein
MAASAQIQLDGDGNWSILENGEVRATYPSRAIRLSVISEDGSSGQRVEHQESDS